MGLIFGQARAKNNNEFIQSDGTKEKSSMEPLPMTMLMGLSPSPPSHNNPKNDLLPPELNRLPGFKN